MALDGIFLRHIGRELEAYLGAKVEKIYQPNRDEIVLALRSRTAGGKLLLSARANSPRVQITDYAPENPATPPMFCMLLRKRLMGGRLAALRQTDLERMLRLEFDVVDELGDNVSLSLVIEIMGRHSNVIFLDGENTIIDALKRVSPEMSSQRMVLPGLAYALPPAQDKLSVLEASAAEILERLRAGKEEVLAKALMSAVQGISPIISRELQYRVCGDELRISEMRETDWERLRLQLEELIALSRAAEGVPYMVCAVDKKPMDFSFLPIQQYGGGVVTRGFDSFSALLDAYYAERDAMERMRVRSHDLLKLLGSISDRLSRKINAQLIDLKKCEERDNLRLYGDLLNANVYRLENGASLAEVENFYEEGNPTLRIPLDSRKTVPQNAQKYYKDYRKAQTAERILRIQVEQARQELEYIDSVFDTLSRASSERELGELRQELQEQGYLRRNRGKARPPAPLPPKAFRTTNGFRVLVGRNNRQNDALTLKQAASRDLWFHVKNIPGSHTVLVTEGREAGDGDILEAASLAAAHSKAADSSQVPVDYAQVRHVKKPPGAKPGMVIYDNYRTVYVTPEKKLLESLAETKI